MRIRDRSTRTDTVQSSYALFPDGRRYESSDIVSIDQLDVMSDVVTPGFKKAQEQGNVFINPMERIRTHGVAPECPWWRQRSTNHGVYYNYEARQGTNGASDRPWTESLVGKEIDRNEALAITAAYAAVGQADLDTLTELAELKETIGFLLSPAKKMVEVTRRARDYIARYDRWESAYLKRLQRWEKANPRYRGARPVRTRAPRARLGRFEMTDIPSAWLAYRYAIMPLIYSFQDIQEHLSRSVYPERVTARAKESGDVNLDTDPPWRKAGGVEFGAIQFRHVRFGNAKVTSRAGVLYVADWSLSRQLGLQLHRVPATLYEVIPLSFVADWFHNGMDVYNGLTAELRAQKILGSWVTTKVEYDYSYQVEASPLDSESTCATGLTCFVGSGSWVRRRKTSLADVKFRFRVDLNAKRVVDALALASTFLATAMKRGKR